MNDAVPAAGWEPGDQLSTEAVRRIKARRDFHTHLLAYGAVNALLFLIWLTTAITAGARFPWFIFPLMGWGVGVGAHAWAVYGSPSQPITDEAITQEIERMRRERRQP
jgi:hypothetical protein